MEVKDFGRVKAYIKRRKAMMDELSCARKHGRLIQVADRARFAAAAAGMKKAADYGFFSLSMNALMVFADAVSRIENPRIVEFGAGCSTIFHDRYFGAAATVDSYEHESKFVDFINTKITHGKVSMHKCPLWQYEDDEFEKIMSGQTTLENMYSMGRPLDESLYSTMRVKNSFYKIDELGERYDAMILDGPHGNGRAVAFAVMRDRLAGPAIILIDDLNHFDFLYSCSRFFKFNILHGEILPLKRWALLEAWPK